MAKSTDVGDNFEMLVTVFAVFVVNIAYLWKLASGTNNQKDIDVTNIEFLSPASDNCHLDEITNIHLSPTSI